MGAGLAVRLAELLGNEINLPCAALARRLSHRLGGAYKRARSARAHSTTLVRMCYLRAITPWNSTRACRVQCVVNYRSFCPDSGDYNQASFVLEFS